MCYDRDVANTKKRRGRRDKAAVSYQPEASAKKLLGQLVDPDVQAWLWRGAAGVRQRVLQLNFDTLRRITGQLPLINAIISTRQDQVAPFLQYATKEGDRGFRFEVEDRTEEFQGAKSDPAEVLPLTTFVKQTGFAFDPLREDDFMDYVSMMVRDLYEIDQIATEIQHNRLGEPIAFWGVDGATISRVIDSSAYKKGVRFIQTINDKLQAEYTANDLIFDYKYKRSDIRYRGYGYSPVEQCINVITTLLFGYNYIKDQLVRDKVPKGFISVMGDVDRTQLDALRSYWYSAMSGAGAQFNIPILPSGKEGVGVDFKSLGQNNRDMEYHKTMMFISAMVGAVFSIDLAELGIKTDDSTTIIGETVAPRLQASKDRGLASMLAFIEQHINKIIRKVTQKYRFRFVGLEKEDEMAKAEMRNKQIAGWRTIDEIRVEDGLEEFKQPWSQMPMNVQAVMMAQGGAAAEEEMGREIIDENGDKIRNDEVGGAADRFRDWLKAESSV